MIRPGRAGDVAALRELETAANARFAGIGMDAVTRYEPTPAERVAQLVDAGQVWVATDDAGSGDGPVVGGILVSVEEGAAHVDQVSVHPAHAGRGHGRALLAAAERWARGRGLPAMTLTTFADVPWNAPYYRRLGFGVVPEAELSPEQRRRAAQNAAGPLGAWPRVTMRRPLT